MLQTGFRFDIIQNTRLYNLNYMIVIFILVFINFVTINLNLLLIYIFEGLFGLIFYNCNIFINNYKPHILLFAKSILLFIP